VSDARPPPTSEATKEIQHAPSTPIKKEQKKCVAQVCDGWCSGSNEGCARHHHSNSLLKLQAVTGSSPEGSHASALLHLHTQARSGIRYECPASYTAAIQCVTHTAVMGLRGKVLVAGGLGVFKIWFYFSLSYSDLICYRLNFLFSPSSVCFVRDSNW